MSGEELIHRVASALELSVLLSLPVLACALGVGLLVSFVQTWLQAHDSSVAYVPKIAGGALVLAASAGWMTRELVHFASGAFAAIEALAK